MIYSDPIESKLSKKESVERKKKMSVPSPMSPLFLSPEHIEGGSLHLEESHGIGLDDYASVSNPLLHTEASMNKMKSLKRQQNRRSPSMSPPPPPTSPPNRFNGLPSTAEEWAGQGEESTDTYATVDTTRAKQVVSPSTGYDHLPVEESEQQKSGSYDHLTPPPPRPLRTDLVQSQATPTSSTTSPYDKVTKQPPVEEAESTSEAPMYATIDVCKPKNKEPAAELYAVVNKPERSPSPIPPPRSTPGHGPPPPPPRTTPHLSSHNPHAPPPRPPPRTTPYLSSHAPSVPLPQATPPHLPVPDDQMYSTVNKPSPSHRRMQSADQILQENASSNDQALYSTVQKGRPQLKPRRAVTPDEMYSTPMKRGPPPPPAPKPKSRSPTPTAGRGIQLRGTNAQPKIGGSPQLAPKPGGSPQVAPKPQLAPKPVGSPQLGRTGSSVSPSVNKVAKLTHLRSESFDTGMPCSLRPDIRSVRSQSMDYRKIPTELAAQRSPSPEVCTIEYRRIQ